MKAKAEEEEAVGRVNIPLLYYLILCIFVRHTRWFSSGIDPWTNFRIVDRRLLILLLTVTLHVWRAVSGVIVVSWDDRARASSYDITRRGGLGLDRPLCLPKTHKRPSG